MTPLRAQTDDAFLLKYLIIGIVCTAFGLWATYDCFVKYPGQIPRAEAWELLLQDKTLDDAARDQKYKEMAKAKNWSIKHPSKEESVESIKSNILWQYIFMAIGFGIGIPLLVWYLRSRNSWIELDGQTIKSSWGQELELKDIIKFDKKKWEKKGIGVIHYGRDGQQKRFVIDDLKFQRRVTDHIVRVMESQLKPEQIVNGPLEKAPQENLASDETAET